MAKVIEFPHQVEDRYCQWRKEYVPTNLKRSKNGSENHVCLDAGNCKRFHLCDAIKIAPSETKLTYAKCCGVCQRFGYCVHVRKNRAAKEPGFIKGKERDYPVRDVSKQADYTKF
jgi:hypothetical protein